MTDASPAPAMGRPIDVRGASAHNLQGVDVIIDRGKITVVTGVSGSGKSSLAFDTVLAEAQRQFFYTLSHYSRQFLDLSARPPVRSVSGLSPAISLAQNETMASRRATVGTLTDVSELLAVLLARFGVPHCPDHDLPTGSMTVDELTAQLLQTSAGQTLAICAPVAEAKKGTFKTQLVAFGERGYLKALVDGELVGLAPPPSLAKEEKHTIKLVLDLVTIKPATAARLRRSLETALAEGKGHAEVFTAQSSAGGIDLASLRRLSSSGGCPVCGFSWPRFDSRHFSANSLGRCTRCDGLGFQGAGLGDEAVGEADDDLTSREELGLDPTCAACRGTGIDASLAAIKLAGASPQALALMQVFDLAKFLRQASAGPLGANAAFIRVAEEAAAALERIDAVGLGYLTLSRRVRGLSAGEAQRLKLAGILAQTLRGVLYVLDEPSQGLHPTEVQSLLRALRHLTELGNTVLVVDHDEELMRGADWIIDLGPGGGARGGRIMAKFPPSAAASFAKQSLTAAFLAGLSEVTVPPKGLAKQLGSEPALLIEGATRHNLQIPSVRFPLRALTTVTGVSGAGKSSLVMQTLYPNAVQAVADKAAKPRDCKRFSGTAGLTHVALVDRKPIAKSSISSPASYLDILTLLRDLFAAQPDAQVMGLTARAFSLSVDAGRCQECKGRGELSLKMRFLADARVRCPVCQGQRFQAPVLQVRYLGLNIHQVLELTLDEVAQTFATHRKIMQRLTPALDLGLGYLKLGQPSASLSGGEAQRLKLVPYLTKMARDGVETLLILDEPTTGLHASDVQKLLVVLRRLIDQGATVVVTEHNRDLIAAADWVIEVGPGAATAGGKLVRQGATAGP